MERKMDKVINFHVGFYSTQVTSFDELMQLTSHAEPLPLIWEALGYYAFYKDHVLDQEHNNMVVAHDDNDLFVVNDEITERHRLITEFDISVLESECQNLPSNFDPKTVESHIARALALYELIKTAENDGMEMGIYNSKLETLAVYNLSFVLGTDKADQGQPAAALPMPPSPHLH